VDSSVLLDVLTGDPNWVAWSEDALADAADMGRFVINPIVYAEVSIGFSAVEDLDHMVPESDFDCEPLPLQRLGRGGKAFLGYRRRGGDRRSPLPDFYIGAHAAVAGYRLLDARRWVVSDVLPLARSGCSLMTAPGCYFPIAATSLDRSAGLQSRTGITR
jgi:predicted nucleic acid-binding protein